MARCKRFFGATVLATAICLGAVDVSAKENVVVAFESKFDSLDYYRTHQTVMQNIAPLIWDTLLKRDPKTGELQPHLVTDWKRMENGVWEFKLRKGVKFHNGNELNAESVRFTIEEWLLDPKMSSARMRGYYRFVDKIEVVDDYTFRLHMKHDDPLVLERMKGIAVYDPAYVKKQGAKGVNIRPMGSGPFKFVSWQASAALVLKKNPAYWEDTGSNIGRFTFKVIPESSSRLSSLLSGDVDLSYEVLGEQAPLIEKSPNHAAKIFPILRVSFWQFDSMGRASKTPLTDVRVRRAISHAINRKAIVENTLGIGGELLNGIGNPAQKCYADGIKPYAYDPAKAKKLLAEAGHAKGFNIDLWQYIDSQNLPNQAAMEDLAKVGIKVKLHDFRGNVAGLSKRRNTGKVTGIGNFAWGSRGVFDINAIIPPWFAIDRPQNYAGDKTLSDWVKDAAKTMNPDERCKKFRKISERIIEQAYWLPFFRQNMIHGHNKKLDYVAGIDEVARLKYAKWKD